MQEISLLQTSEPFNMPRRRLGQIMESQLERARDLVMDPSYPTSEILLAVAGKLLDELS
jgi:hypothetical protein